MGANQRSAADAVHVLNAVARLLRASPYKNENPDWAETHAEYLEDVAVAVKRDAAIDAQVLEDGARWAGREWEHALIPILFGYDRLEEIDRRL